LCGDRQRHCDGVLFAGSWLRHHLRGHFAETLRVATGHELSGSARRHGLSGLDGPEQGPATGSYATIEWNGPDSALFKRTRVYFLDGKLLSYSTEHRGAL
jgi:hypothetical protein